MTKLPILAAALFLGASTAALAGAATDDASRAAASAANEAAGVGGAATAGYGSSTAPVQATPEMRARALIAANGYDMISDLEPIPGGFEATAVKEGKVMGVTVDNAGHVRRTR
jgi:hypothetical protein